MKQVSTYKVKIKEYNHIFDNTIMLYRGAVDFYISVINDNWSSFNSLSQKSAVNLSEELTLITKKRPNIKYDFSLKFYKFPSYLRRAAIAEAFGKVSSYRSNLSNWENTDKRERGEKPSYPKSGYIFPAMYRDNCFIRTGTYTARLKVYINNTWDWLTINLNKGDVDYIIRRCGNRKECVPTLRRRGKNWYLDFAFESLITLNTVPVNEQRILSVDLGINNSCVCVCMNSDGTILGKHFLKLSREYDCLNHKLSHIKSAQKHGSHDVHNLFRVADGVNKDIAVKTSTFIIDTAALYNADTIVFEHLDLGGKKKGSKKERLHHWRARYVQDITTHKAHALGIRISRINAWGTSRLAFDGSGYVKRGKDSDKTYGNYSLCEFSTGKVYNCDLNAAYNIGARYFVREIIKTLPVTVGQCIQAKVPGCMKRSTCTLSTLISLNAELCAAV